MLSSPTLIVILMILAVARLTRLVNEDSILDRPRAWIQEHAPDSVAYLVTCPWCVSIWLGAGAAAVTYNWPRSWPVQIAILGLAASMVTGILAQIIRLMEES